LQGSLDILETLSLREAKILMDLLLLLVNSNQAESSKDELSIMIKKQLSHPDIKFKKLGVVGAVLTLKITMGTSNSDGEDSPDMETNLKESEVLFNAVKESTTNYPCSSALFMDELATNILKNGLNQRLEKWISEKVIGDFEETFILDCETEGQYDKYICPVSFQWNLDDFTDSEKSKSIAVCIAKLVTEDLEHSDLDHSSRIVTVAPHFRLMRMVESHLYAGDLGNIDALLGCGVQMPTPETYEEFSSLSDKEQTFALTCLFYAINWFRELINAFATQKDKELKRKVVLRLRKLLSLQGLLVKVLKEKSSFQPPPATFDIDIEYKMEVPVGGKNKSKTIEKKRGKKRKLDDEKAGPSQTQNVLTTQAVKGSSLVKETSNLNVKACKAFLRELHLDVFNLLFKKLCLDNDSDKDNDSYLFVNEADFLISDLNEKFGRAFESGTKRACVLKSQSQKDVGFAHFDVFTAPEVAEQALRYIKPICAHLETICIFFQKIISEEQEESDEEDLDKTSLYSIERTLPIVNLYTSLFTSLRLFLSWPSLQLLEHSNLMKSCFKLFARKLELNQVEEMNTEELVSTSFKYLSKFCDSLVNIGTAVELVQLLDVLISFTGSGKLKEQLGKIISKFLKRNWTKADGNETKGSLFAINLRTLLKTFFCCSVDPVNDAYSITSDGIKELCEASTGKNPSSKEYPTLNKNTLSVYYSVLLKNLASGTKKMLLTKYSNNYEMLELWSVSVKTLHLLTESLRKFETSSMFTSCLKHSKEYLDLFLQEGMPLFEKCLKKHQQEVTALLKNLQLTTRFLQNLCTVVKSNKDSKAVHYVPNVKLSLEAIVFRVKAMLTLYNCQTAFWLGNLKNRDLQGNELLSQSTQNEDSDNDEVSDEGLSDVDVEDNADGDAKKVDSYSVSY
ncbi:Fanconi anemia group D2 protein, partial [Armadillidium nasatum]